MNISTTSVFSQEVIANDQDKDNFLQGCLTVYTNHTYRQISCPAVDDQHKTNSLVFLESILLFVVS